MLKRLPRPQGEFAPLGAARFIARVGDRELTDLTRVVWLRAAIISTLKTAN